MDYYQHDLALVHARGFGRHADRAAPRDADDGRRRQHAGPTRRQHPTISSR
jgi:hypothetical protein